MSETTAEVPNRPEFRLTDAHQVAIHRRLQLVGPEVADFFHDGCAIMAGANNLRSQTHLAAHLLREIDGRLRDVLEPLFGEEGRARIDEASKEKQTHRAEIAESGRVLRLDQQVIDLWTEFALPLHEFAHRESLAGPRAVEEFERQWELALIVLDAVTQRFETVYLDTLALLKRLAAKNAPSKADKTELRGRLPHSDVLLGEFFERAGLGWFNFLEEVGYFRNPRPLRPNPDGSVGYIQWPPGRFLVRAAAQPRLRHRVTEIFATLDTDNPEAQESAIAAALAMPPAEAAAVVPAVVGFLNVPYQWRLPIEAEKLAVHLVEGGEVIRALDLARALLEPLVSGSAGWRSRLILDTLTPKLFPAAGVEGVELLEGLLARALDSEDRDANDLSHMWRPSIEGGRDARPRDVLVSSLRDASEAVVDADPSTLAAVIEVLERDSRSIFRRLALHLLRRHPDEGLIAERLGDHALFCDYNLDREYALLAADWFPMLPSEVQCEILGWIVADPHFRPQGLEADEVEEWDERWRLSELRALGGRDNLPPRWQERYDQLVARFGEPSDPGAPPRERAVWSGVISPVTQEQIVAKGDDELLAFLDSWEPPDANWRAPSVEGLASELRSATTTDVARFAALLPRLADLEPIYGRFVLLGLHHSVTVLTPAEWQAVLAFGEAIAAKPAVIEGRTDDERTEVDPGWGWGRLEVVRVLDRGLRMRAFEAADADRIWELIEPLTHDPNPDADADAQDGDSGGGPAFRSHNSWRGIAMHAVCAFGWWRSKVDTDAGETAELPEAVREVLGRHLDPTIEPTETIRAVYGDELGYLIEADPEWTAAHATAIFPADADHLWLAAWRGYIDGQPFYRGFWTLLEAQYERAIIALADLPVDADPNVDERLIGSSGELLGHLLCAYVQDYVGLDSDSLLDRFLEVAPLRLRAQLIEMIGIDLENADAVSDQTQTRLQRLWEVRFDAVATGADGAAELSGFAWWFGSGKLPGDWSFEQLNRLATTTHNIGFSHVVTQRLRALADTHLSQVMQSLALLVEHVDDTSLVLGADAEIRYILSAALTAQEATATTARETVSRLYAKGYRGFTELLMDDRA